MGQKFSRLMLRLMGWKAMDPPVPEKKCIILGVPHTSILDYPVSYFYYNSVGGKCNIMVKKEFFFWPVGAVLKRLGAVPVDRERGRDVLRQTIEEFKKREYLQLALAPEGTRAPVKKWKSGYHRMAMELGIPVYMGYFDWKTKRVGRGEKIELTGDAHADLVRIQQHYKKMGVVGRHPEKLAYLDEVTDSGE